MTAKSSKIVVKTPMPYYSPYYQRQMNTISAIIITHPEAFYHKKLTALPTIWSSAGRLKFYRSNSEIKCFCYLVFFSSFVIESVTEGLVCSIWASCLFDKRVHVYSTNPSADANGLWADYGNNMFLVVCVCPSNIQSLRLGHLSPVGEKHWMFFFCP